MNFTLDLIDAVAIERPDEVVPLVRQAAQSGQHLVVQRWLDDYGFDESACTPEFVEAMIEMTRSAHRMGQGEGAKSAFTTWAQRAYEGRSQELSSLLDRCIPPTSRWMDRSDLAASALLALGADPLSLSSEGRDVRPLAGTRVDLTERNVTLLAQAMQSPGDFCGAFLDRASTTREPWPVVAEVGVAGAFYPVNAAGYAIALGDMRALHLTISNARGDERSISRGLNEAIAFVLDSGLIDRCTPEVHHGLAVCIARGADLDTGLLGKRLVTQELSQAAEVFGATDARYHLPVLFLGCNEDQAVASAISRLAKEYCMRVNGPASDTEHAPTLLHYAVATDRPAIVQAVLTLGADPAAPDARGMTPVDWAKKIGRKRSLAVLTGQDANLSAGEEWPLESVPAHGPFNATTHSPDDEAWSVEEGASSPHESRSLSLEEIEAQGGPGLADYDGDIASFEAPEGFEPPDPIDSARPADRERVAPSVTEAKASPAATLFDRLLSNQAKLRERAAAVTQNKELATAEAGAGGTQSAASSGSSTRGFRRRIGP